MRCTVRSIQTLQYRVIGIGQTYTKPVPVSTPKLNLQNDGREQMADNSVISLDSLDARVTILEGKMSTVQIETAIAKTAAIQARDNTAELLAIATGVKKVGSFVTRYGPKAIIFGAGIMSAAGIGNPKVQQVLSFISTFFGG